jgi:hypothetical protein
MSLPGPFEDQSNKSTPGVSGERVFRDGYHGKVKLERFGADDINDTIV